MHAPVTTAVNMTILPAVDPRSGVGEVRVHILCGGCHVAFEPLVDISITILSC